MKSIFTLILGLLICHSLQASEAQVKAFIFNSAPHGPYKSYAAYIDGRFVVSYKNEALPWGTRVDLIYAFRIENRTGYPYNWGIPSPYTNKRTYESAMTAAAPYQWDTLFDQVLADASTQTITHALQFVFKVTLPDGTIFYDKGNDSPMGYFHAGFYDFIKNGKARTQYECERTLTPYTPLPVESIRK